ncbi:unnamed protein product [Caenorhabditis auriculariae]|uniref:Uridine diphosphate glucose pyrophosphatase NUDT14 n=1 Tax=Caenorhabditis auriculariae TaxID=2777116 RepID=A0A8S1H928_9PELO|nr:unnamed protein product [Caenorhabditis auriculariae]
MAAAGSSDRVTNVSFITDFVSKYQKGLEMEFDHGTSRRKYEYNVKFSSVAVLLYHTELNKLLMVRQFRPAVFVGRVSRMAENLGKSLEEIEWEKYDANLGYTLELCAGIIDKDLPIADVAREEVAEECGYAVRTDDLLPIFTSLTGTHQTGNTDFMFYAEIDESMKISEGGGNLAEGEAITKLRLFPWKNRMKESFQVFLTPEEARQMLVPSKNCVLQGPAGVLLAIQWWLHGRSRGSPITSSNDIYEPINTKNLSNFSFKDALYRQVDGYAPRRMFFTLGPMTRSWDLALAPNNVVILLFDKASQELILTQMFRPAAFVGRARKLKENAGKQLSEIGWESYDVRWSYPLELDGCLVEPKDDLFSTATSVAQKLGYRVDVASLLHIGQFVTGVSQSGNVQDVFFSTVNGPSTKPLDTESDVIERRFHVSVLPQLFQQRSLGPPTTYFAIQWFLENQSLVNT